MICLVTASTLDLSSNPTHSRCVCPNLRICAYHFCSERNTSMYYHLRVHCNVQSASINMLWSARICFQKAFDQVLSHLLGLNDTNRMWQSCSPFTCSLPYSMDQATTIKVIGYKQRSGIFLGNIIRDLNCFWASRRY